jgi:hypothetical protein
VIRPSEPRQGRIRKKQKEKRREKGFDTELASLPVLLPEPKKPHSSEASALPITRVVQMDEG